MVFFFCGTEAVKVAVPKGEDVGDFVVFKKQGPQFLGAGHFVKHGEAFDWGHGEGLMGRIHIGEGFHHVKLYQGEGAAS